MLPDVTNLSRFWRMLASCTIRRRMEETGEDLVDIYYNEVNVPLGIQQAEQTKEWLKKLPDGFPGLFKEKYPDHPLVANGMVDSWAPMIGLNWKLDYAATIPQGDPDYEWTEIPVTNWTPANLKALQLCMALAKSGRKVLFGSHLVPTGKWMAERLQEKGVSAVHIVDESGTTASAKKRAQHVYSFQNDPDVQVFCAGMKAIRLGHNLDAANAVVLNGLDFDYETLDQFIKRVRRLTSKLDIDVYVILPTLSGQETITSRKWQLLGMKGNAADLALDGQLIKKVEQEISEADMIRELQEKGLHVTDEAVPESEVEKAWEMLPQLDALDDYEAMIPLRPRKEEVEEEVTDEAVVLTDHVPDEVPDELVEEQNAVEFDAIDEAEAEFAAEDVEPVPGVDFPVNVEEDLFADDPDSELPDRAFEPETDYRDTFDGLLPEADPAIDASHTASVDAKPTVPLFDSGDPGLAEEASELFGDGLVSDDTKSDDVVPKWKKESDEPLSLFDPDEPVSPQPPTGDPVALLKGAKELLDLGIIDQAEFDTIKAAQLRAMGVTA